MPEFAGKNMICCLAVTSTRAFFFFFAKYASKFV